MQMPMRTKTLTLTIAVFYAWYDLHPHFIGIKLLKWLTLSANACTYDYRNPVLVFADGCVKFLMSHETKELTRIQSVRLSKYQVNIFELLSITFS